MPSVDIRRDGIASFGNLLIERIEVQVNMKTYLKIVVNCFELSTEDVSILRTALCVLI